MSRARSVARRLLGRQYEPPPLRPVAPAALLEHARHGALPLSGKRPAADAPLHVATVVPAFRKGSGGHSTIATLLRGLEDLGHTCTVWVDDEEGRHASDTDIAGLWRSFFGPLKGRVELGFSAWSGCDVVMATGWQTVHRTLRLPDCAGRAYLVQDHEPEFYGTSAERIWAEATYRLGLHCICASQWLADLVRDRYGATTTAFDLGVDHDTYSPRDVERRDDLVIAYARAVTPRRAVPMVLLAMEELHHRRPHIEICLFGESAPIETRFPHTNAGVLEPDALAELYSRAAVGVVLSLTNPSLVPTEMLACGLPVVDVASDAMRATFGADGPIALSDVGPVSIGETVERLLDDPADHAGRVRRGLDLAAGRRWGAAAEALERGLRTAQ
jgi:O-antigen biosynthesis protein